MRLYDKKNVSYLFLAIFSFFVIFFVLKGRNEDTAKREIKREIPLGHVADTTYRFLRNTFEGDKEIYNEQACDLSGCQVLKNDSELPTYSWYLLAHARAMSIADSPGLLTDKEKKNSAEFLGQLLLEWSKKANLVSEMYSIHQLYSVFELTKEKPFLFWFFGRLPRVETHTSGNLIGAERLDSLEVYLHAALIRQFANGATALLNTEIRKVLEEGGQLKYIDDHESLALHYLDFSKQLLDSLKKDELPDEKALGPLIQQSDEINEAIPQFACFNQWGKVAVYEAFSLAASESSEPEKNDLENELIEFFSTLNRYHHQGGKIGFRTLQSVMSCIHTLNDMERLKIIPDNLHQMKEHLFLSYVLPQLDSETKGVCEKDGAFFSFILSDGKLDCQSGKDIVDNSWLYFLLDEKMRGVIVSLE